MIISAEINKNGYHHKIIGESKFNVSFLPYFSLENKPPIRLNGAKLMSNTFEVEEKVRRKINAIIKMLVMFRLDVKIIPNNNMHTYLQSTHIYAAILCGL